MEPKDFSDISSVMKKDFAGLDFEFYSATFEAGEIPETYHVFITGANENGFTSVDSNFINLRETSPVKTIHEMGFTLFPYKDSIHRMRGVGRFGNYDGLTILVKRKPNR